MQPTAAQLATTGGVAQEGAWYGGQRYMGGQLLAPGQDQAGHTVSADVIAQTNPNNVAYVQNLQQQAGITPTTAPASVINGQSNGGSGSLGGTFGAPATIDLQKIYDNALADAGVTDLQKQSSDLKTQLNDQTNGINANPLLSEASRTGKIKTLSDYAQGKIDNLDSQITQAKADAQIKVNLASGQFTQNQQVYQDNLGTFNALLSSGALNSASGSDVANLALSIGVPTSVIQSAVDYQTQKDTPTSVITNTDDNGNVTASVINTRTGAVVKQTSLGQVAASKASAGSPSIATALQAMTPKLVGKLNSYGNISPADWQQALAAWIGAGLSTADFIKNYGQYADTNRGDFLQAYGFANPKNPVTIKANQAAAGSTQ